MGKISLFLEQNLERTAALLIEMAKKGEYTRYTSTRIEDWLVSVREIARGIAGRMDGEGHSSYLHVDECLAEDETIAFGIKEAGLHRSRGVTLPMFLGLTKYYRQAFIKTVEETGELEQAEKERAVSQINLYFDRFEIGFCDHWASLSRDGRVAELQKLNRALTNEKNKFHTIFQSMSEPVIVVDSERKIKEINRAAVECFGLNYREVLNRPCYEVLKCAYESPQCPLARAMREAGRYDNMEIGIEVGGRCRRFLTSGSFLEDISGKFAGGVEVFIDVTEAKEYEQKLLLARDNAGLEAAKLRAMISGMGEGVVFADANDRITEVNDFFLNLFGHTREKLIGKSIYDFHSHDTLGRVKELIGSFKAHESSAPLTVTRRFKDLELIMRVQPIYRNGLYEGVLLNVIDVTELSRARIEAERARELAESASRAKSDFLANMSHEIRTPMNGILGFAEILLNQGLNAEQRESVKGIALCGEQLLELINDILDLSKIESGKMVLEETEFDLKRLLGEALTSVRQKARDKGLALRVRIGEGVPCKIIGDSIKIRQVLSNLLSNAVKFTIEGRIEVAVSRKEGESAGEDIFPLLIEVRDTGIGVPDDKIESIFESFTQAEESTSRKFGGTGLGLAISRSLVELMGGEIWVKPNQPAGSVFSFCIPVKLTLPKEGRENVEDMATPGLASLIMGGCPAAVAENGSKAGPAGAVPSGGGKEAGEIYRILVAEDNLINQKIIDTFLRSEGYQVRLVKDGREVLAALEKESFDLILMDMQMPFLNGYQTTAKIKSRPDWAGIPVVAVTAYAMKGDMEKCLAVGCDYYLPKPVKKDQLLDLINKIKQLSPARDQGVGRDPEALISFFVSSVSQEVEESKKALCRKDYKTLSFIGHGLKGSGGSYGFPALSELGAAIEDAAGKEDEKTLAELLGQVSDYIRGIKCSPEGEL